VNVRKKCCRHHFYAAPAPNRFLNAGQARVGKNPDLKKNPAWWVFLGFIGFFWVLLGFIGFFQFSST
jgi:hypothetical protein